MAKRLIALLLVLCCAIPAGCAGRGAATDYPAAIMVGGTIYYRTQDEIADVPDDIDMIGYTEYTDGFPKNDGEANFGRNGVPYTRYGDGIAVRTDGKWYYCSPRD